VVARRAFYNHSAFDGNDATAGAADDAAVAPGVLPLLPGDAQTLAGATTYSRGLNGVFIDVAALPGGAALTPDDFAFRRSAGAPAAWTAAAVPSSITVRRGAGVNGSDRVTLVWPDYDPANPNATAVANGWLEVTVKATERTGLASPDVFAFGNLIGDADASGRVNSLDLGAVKALLNTAAPIGSRVDFNRDGRVNALDLGFIKQRLNRSWSNPGSGRGAYSPFADLDGSGTINASDLGWVKWWLNTRTPPTAAPATALLSSTTAAAH
jgi:hypothetical protein